MWVKPDEGLGADKEGEPGVVELVLSVSEGKGRDRRGGRRLGEDSEGV